MTEQAPYTTHRKLTWHGIKTYTQDLKQQTSSYEMSQSWGFKAAQTDYRWQHWIIYIPEIGTGVNFKCSPMIITAQYVSVSSQHAARLVCLGANSPQSHRTLCGSADCSSPGSSVHGILQARTLEWVAMPSSRDHPDPGTLPLAPPGKPYSPP